MNKSHTAGWLWSCAAVLLVTMPALAGPLDRQDIEPRRNPAADSMIRVPGVVGMDYQGAMQALQQAGLNPILKTERTPNPRYEGREGTVIQQLPRPGGMAMYGSSVTITYYQPAQTPQAGQPPSGPPSAPEGQAGGGPPPAQTPPASSLPAPGPYEAQPGVPTRLDQGSQTKAPSPGTAQPGTVERPKAVLSAPGSVQPGRGFVLDGSRSSAAAGRTIVKYLWSWVNRGLSAETTEPRMEVTSTDDDPIPAGLNQFQLAVEDDMGNRSEPASARVTVQRPPAQKGKPQPSKRKGDD